MAWHGEIQSSASNSWLHFPLNSSCILPKAAWVHGQFEVQLLELGLVNLTKDKIRHLATDPIEQGMLGRCKVHSMLT